jgi:N-acetylglucosamine kinase-like BadF-type ATPase
MTLKRYFLGVDTGNTKSHALLADEQGRAVGFGHSGPGSWEAIGWQGAQQVLHDITGQALAQAGVEKADIWGAGFGFAGYDWPEDRAGHQRLIDELGLTNAAVRFGNDALVGLVAGATAGWGVVVAAGTSNNCLGWDESGREGRITGQGPRFAEYGGASEIVTRAVQAIALAWTRRGPETALSQALVGAAGANDVADLFAGMTRERYEMPPAIAPLVFEVATAGDAVAQEIVRWAGCELGNLAVGVIRQLELQQLAFDVVLSGSIYKGSPTLIDEMTRTIHSVAPQARLVRLEGPPVVGGVLLGMTQVGVDTSLLRSTLGTTTNELLASS